MSLFNLTDEKMKQTSSTFTAHEIYQQPVTWRKTCAQLAACKDELQAFFDQIVKQEDFDIILTGAGTSEFVGNSLYQALNPNLISRSSLTPLPILSLRRRISCLVASPHCW